MSSLLIGLVDQAISPFDVISWDVNKIGGKPIWLNGAPHHRILQCSICGREMSLVSQLYCPLGESAYHRCLYIFVCLTQGCESHNRMRVFRSLKFDSTYKKSEDYSNRPGSETVNQDMWAEDQDDWGDEDDEWGNNNDTCHQDENNCSANTKRCDAFTNLSDGEMDTGTENGPQKPFKSHLMAMSSQDHIHYSNAESSVSNELPTALSQMTLVDHSKSKHQPDINIGLSSASQVLIDSSPHENDGVVGEDIGPHSDRYEELAKLLNTKFNAQNPAQEVSHGDSASIFQPFYLYVIEEPQAKDEKLSKHVSNLIKEYEKSEGKCLQTLMTEGAKSKKKGATESYEKTELKHGDRTFHKFLKRLQTCPEQCIRYNRGGDPLLAVALKEEESIIPACPRCGSPRMCELQLLPALIPWLVLKERDHPVEFSTVLIFTCDNNCAPADSDHDFLEEVAILQEDPDQHLYR